MKNPHTIWAAVAVVFMLLAAAVLMELNDKSANTILVLAGLVAVPVLGGFGAHIAQKLEQVKEASNGNLTKVLEMQEKTQNQLTQLALMVAPPPIEKLEDSDAGFGPNL